MQDPPFSELHWFELNNFYPQKKKTLNLNVQMARVTVHKLNAAEV